MITPAWEHLKQEPHHDDPVLRLADHFTSAQTSVANDAPGPSCIVWDEDMAAATVVIASTPAVANHLPDAPKILSDTDAFARQGDKGPYHWAQGPLDVSAITIPLPPITPPVSPSPGNPHPAKPGTLPKRGKALTTSHLRLRQSWGTRSHSLGVMPTGTTVSLTGGRHKINDDLWVRVRVDELPPSSGNLKGDDVWLVVPPGVSGWVDADFLAVPASEYVAADFPTLTHEWRWFLDDPGGLDADTIKRTFTAIAEDARGVRRAGINLRETDTREDAHILIRMVDAACGGAAGCYYKASHQIARADIVKEYFNTSWLSRVLQHEVVGHGCCRSYDHYDGAPQYPRADYYGIMGNWQDHYGDHAWPDEDDIENWREWLQGKSQVVFVRDDV